MANCPNIPNIYVIHKKELKHFGLEILVIHGVLEYIALNICKYIFTPQSGKKNIELFTKISELFREISTLSSCIH